MFIEIPDNKRSRFPSLYSASVEKFPNKPEGLNHEYFQFYTDRDGNMVIKRGVSFLKVAPLDQPPRYHPQAALKPEDTNMIKTILLRAEDLQTGRLVAAKAAYIPGVSAEAEILQRVAHPGIVSYLDLAVSDKGINNSYIIMEWLSGGTLDDWIESGIHQTTEVASVFDQTAAAINHVNETGYLYADAKPANILFNQEGVVKLVDFGNCVPLESDGSSLSVSPFATYNYASPEQKEAVSRGGKLYLQSDVYSLAAVLFAMLTRVEYGARDNFLKNGNLSMQLRPEYQAGIPPIKHERLAEILQRAFAEDYQERQTNVGILNAEVQEALSG